MTLSSFSLGSVLNLSTWVLIGFLPKRSTPLLPVSIPEVPATGFGLKLAPPDPGTLKGSKLGCSSCCRQQGSRKGGAADDARSGAAWLLVARCLQVKLFGLAPKCGLKAAFPVQNAGTGFKSTMDLLR